jgi:hypothetical protein
VLAERLPIEFPPTSVCSVLSWSEFADVRPGLAREVAAMFYAHGLGLGFLATTRSDGGPRVHPICPILSRDLYAFILPGPKLEDLRRDGRFALHSETFAPPRHDDGAYLTGQVAMLGDSHLVTSLTKQVLVERNLDEPWPGFAQQTLVEFKLDRVLVTLTEARDGLPQGHSIWHA